MNGAFSIALSSLQGNQDAISATGQNLANLNTTGYKGNFVEFRDLVAQSASAMPGTQQGLGITKPVVQTIFSDGSIASNSSPYAAAIQGDGFFVVTSATDGKQLYTRDGNFTLDKDGYLKTLSGENVQGWNENNGVLDTSSSAASPIQLAANSTSPPIATSALSFTANLNAATATATGGTEITVPVSAVDSLGATHNVQVTFTKTATAGSWGYSVTIPGEDLTSGTAGTPTQLTKGTLTFASDGTLTAQTNTAVTPNVTINSTITNAGPPVTTSPNPAFGNVPVAVTGLKNGASNMNMSWSLVGTDAAKTPLITQFAQKAQYDAVTQDGIPSGTITKISMADGGQVVASFSNGQTRPVAQLALAKFVNNDALIGVGNNNFSASVLSSAPSIGTAGSKGIGQVIAKALEGSNVDVATQFTNLITYQRGYQASSKVITTADQMLQQIMDLIR